MSKISEPCVSLLPPVIKRPAKMLNKRLFLGLVMQESFITLPFKAFDTIEVVVVVVVVDVEVMVVVVEGVIVEGVVGMEVVVVLHSMSLGPFGPDMPSHILSLLSRNLHDDDAVSRARPSSCIQLIENSCKVVHTPQHS